MLTVDVKIQETQEIISYFKAQLAKYENDLLLWNTIKNERSSTSKDKLNYPSKASAEQQVMHILLNIIGEACKMKDIEDNYKLFNRSNTETLLQIHQVVRRMKKEGVISAVKYNRQNKTTFWGLKDWMGVDDFKEKYKPKENKRPVRIFDKEVL